MSSSSSWFGGEPYLQVSLPHYESERRIVTLLLILNGFFWVFLLPILTSPSQGESTKDQVAKQEDVKKTKITAATKNGRRPARDKKTKIETSTAAPSAATKVAAALENEHPASATASVFGLFLVTFIILLKGSPHNYYTSRRVFMAPLLSSHECQFVIEMAQRAAHANFQRALTVSNTTDDPRQLQKSQILQMEPQGWQKTRHGSYPTTDLNLVTDPFSQEDRQWLEQRLHARLAPLLSRIFGIPARSIRANDLFVVRYDAPPETEVDNNAVHRAFLANHTDDSDISFNVLLNDAFEGGGTRFWDRWFDGPFAHVQPTRPGTVLTHSALINHEGATVTRGTRMILVGFLSVDRLDPFEQTPTGLTNLASWGCGSWLTTKFKQAYTLRLGRNNNPELKTDSGGEHWSDNVYVRQLLLEMVGFFQLLGDAFATHTVEKLVPDDKADDYLHALDQAFDKHQVPKEQRAVWWQGQGLHLDVDGSIAREWITRSDNAQAFEDL